MVSLTDRPDMTLDVYRGRKTNNTTTTTNQSRDLRFPITAWWSTVTRTYFNQLQFNHLAMFIMTYLQLKLMLIFMSVQTVYILVVWFKLRQN